MRVGIIHTALDGRGGGDRQVLELANELQKLGHDLTLYTVRLDRERCFQDLLEPLEVVPVPKTHLWRVVNSITGRLGIGSLRYAEMRSIARAIRPGVDILNCHNLSSNWPTAKAKRRLGVPAVWMCNEPPWRYHTPRSQAWWRNLIEMGFLASVDIPAAHNMDRITVLDNKNERRVQQIYGMQANVVRSGVDAKFFDTRRKGDSRDELHLMGRFVLLHVGYAAPWKGQLQSIQTLKAVEESIPEVHLILVGHHMKEFCSPIVQELGLSDRVTFLEYVSEETLVSLYATADVVLFQANQTWGLNVTEAMAASRPVIVSSEAGVSEIVEEGVTGFVVPHDSVPDIERRVLQLYRDPGLRRRMGEAAREYVAENLTWRNFALQMLRVFEDALAESERKRPRRTAPEHQSHRVEATHARIR